MKKRYTEWGRVGILFCRLPLYRFLAKVQAVEGGCWEWTGGRYPKGYGQFWDQQQNRDRRAHRWSYEWFIGPIPDELQIDHLCRNRCCVNPTHLEPVTARENTRRGESIAGHYGRQTHCNRGHPFDAINTYRSKGGRRTCRECVRLSQATRRAAARVELPRKLRVG